MIEQEKNVLLAKMTQEIARLYKDIATLEQITQPVAAEDMDEITRMDSIVNKSVNDAALSSARRRLAALEFASKRIGDEDFGYCAECGEAIPIPRLMVMPETVYCVSCAEEASR